MLLQEAKATLTEVFNAQVVESLWKFVYETPSKEQQESKFYLPVNAL